MKKIIGIAGWSGSGKTTLVEGLIDIFKNHYNLRVCAIKHAHKNFTIDQEGKDSYKFTKAGAERVIVSSINQWTIINKVQKEENIENLLKFTSDFNIVLVEGWKFSNLKKIEVHRSLIKKNVLFKEDKNIIAVATDNPDLIIPNSLKKLNLNNHLNIADFIINKNFGI